MKRIKKYWKDVSILLFLIWLLLVTISWFIEVPNLKIPNVMIMALELFNVLMLFINVLLIDDRIKKIGKKI